MTSTLRIGRKTYHRENGGTFEVEFEDLADVTFANMPCGSTITVVGLTDDAAEFRLDISMTHAMGECESNVFMHFHLAFCETGDRRDLTIRMRCDDKLRHIERHFAPLVSAGILDEPGEPHRNWYGGKWHCHTLYGNDRPIALSQSLGQVARPVVQQYRQMLQAPITLAFICHATEDRQFVDDLVRHLDRYGIPAWLDRREIKVGDSIVTQIQDGLSRATHLIVILSSRSVSKPWVRRELSSALFRQLRDSSIQVLPVLAEPCEIPLLLRDVKYADCSHAIADGIIDLVQALGGSSQKS